MALLTFSFNFSSLADLKQSKCKDILEKLEELEESIYERLNVQPIFKEDSSANSPINQSNVKGNKALLHVYSDNNFQKYTQNNSEQKNSKKVPNLSLNTLSSVPLKKSTMAKTPRLQISNFNYVTDSPRDNGSKGLFKY